MIASQPSKKLHSRSYERFRHKARIIRRLCSVCLALSSYVRDAAHLGKSGQVISKTRMSYKTDNNTLLEFDPSEFRRRSIGEFTWPPSAVFAIGTKASLRTKHDIRKIACLMQQITLFRRLPFDIQRNIAGVVQYVRIESNRVVLREGHPGFAYYFIFSGSVTVTLPQSGHKLILCRGRGFGETALLEDRPRTATVLCVSTAELLVVEADDFFTTGLAEYLTAARQRKMDFIAAVPLFRNLSSSAQQEVLKESYFERYLDDEVIVKDSTRCPYVWIIYEGCCDVFRRVEPSAIPSATFPSSMKVESDTRLAPARVRFAESSSGEDSTASNNKLRRNMSAQYSRSGEQRDRTTTFFVNVGHLKVFDVFGLTNLLDTQEKRQFSIVSRCVEVLRIEKPLILALVSTSLLQTAQRQTEIFPSDIEITQRHAAEVKWSTFKRSVVTMVLLKMPTGPEALPTASTLSVASRNVSRVNSRGGEQHQKRSGAREERDSYGSSGPESVSRLLSASNCSRISEHQITRRTEIGLNQRQGVVLGSNARSRPLSVISSNVRGHSPGPLLKPMNTPRGHALHRLGHIFAGSSREISTPRNKTTGLG